MSKDNIHSNTGSNSTRRGREEREKKKCITDSKVSLYMQGMYVRIAK
jgi:hypothetical protein